MTAQKLIDDIRRNLSDASHAAYLLKELTDDDTVRELARVIAAVTDALHTTPSEYLSYPE